MTLHEFLALPHRFRWGGLTGDDCTTFCATWAAELTGVDPAEDLRGTYRDAEGAHGILSKAGGIIPFMAGRLATLGFKSTAAAADGDIGVVLAPVGVGEDFKEIGAIRFGPMWAMLAPAGVVARRVECVAAWRWEGEKT
jgi:hypothetical protein